MKATISNRLRLLIVILTILGCASVISLRGTGFSVVSEASPSVGDSEAPTAGFPAQASTLGPIPDGVGCVPTPGAARDVQFVVSGIVGTPTSVSVSVAMNHTWVGDLIATLFAPNDNSIVLFGRTGATTSSSTGDSSNLDGTYVFSDTAVSGNMPSGGWWQEATFQTTGALTPGTYRSTAIGGAGQTSPAPATSMNSAFTGSLANGVWTLRLTDGCGGDTGSVTGAILHLNGGQNIVDMNGDGRTDYTIARNIGGGSSGQVAWFTKYNGAAGTQVDVFGTASDWFMSDDFDGDNKSDVTVWRPNPVAAFFYVMRSSTATFQAIQWGITGDNPSVIGDYDGDGKADPAVYRPGASAGQQSFWHILKSSDGGYLPIQWGQNGDFTAPGDYDGDGRTDAAVQRGVGGQGIFYIRFFDGSFSQTVFGAPTDFITPGDYDGDGRTDIAVTRPISGQRSWFHDPSSIPGTQVVQTIFGATGDWPAPGDYDGDGRTDQAVWRGSTTPGQSAFYVNGSAAGFFAYAWGQSGDYPVANYNVH